MAYAGEQIYNPGSHEHFTLLKTAEDTDGKVLIFDCRVTPGGAVLQPHVHEKQEERFFVMSGMLGVRLGNERHTLTAGQSIVLPPRIVHQWWNAGEDEVRFRVEVYPARDLETVLEALSGLAYEGKLNRYMMPKNPFMLAQLGKTAETYLPVIPIWMQKPMLTIGSGLGWMLGYDFRRYKGEGVTRSAATLAEMQAA